MHDDRLIEKFLDHVRQRGRKNKTLESYHDAFAAFRNFQLLNKDEPPRLAALNGLDVREWKSHMLGCRRAPATINHRLGVLKHFAEWAHRLGHLKSHQLETVIAVPEVASQKLGAVTLEPEPFRRFLRVVEMSPNIRDQALIHLALNGLRISELVGLKVQDVTVSSNRGVVEVRGEHVKRSAHRIVPLSRQARIHLKLYLEREQPMDHVFVGQRGALTESGVDKIIRKYGAAVGIQTHCHLLRHQFSALYLAQNPGDLVGLQHLLGHASVDTTARFYVRKRLSDLEESVSRIEL